MPIPELEVTVTIRNNRLKKARLALGLSQPEMSRLISISISSYGDYERMGKSPLCKDGTWRSDAVAIANFTCCSVEELWPEAVLRIPERKAVRELNAEEALFSEGSREMALPPYDNFEVRNLKGQVEKALDTLPPREADVLRKRFGVDQDEEMTLGEVAASLDTLVPRKWKGRRGEKKRVYRVIKKGGVTKERARLIEASALRKLRHPSRSKLLRSFIEN